MKTKIIYPVFALLLSGCGVYPYYDYIEEDIYVYEEPIGITWESYDYPHTIVKINVDFETYGESSESESNVDLLLETPAGITLTSAYGSLDGCTHFGDDRGTFGHGEEEIECLDPFLGTHKVVIANRSYNTVKARLTIEFLDPDHGRTSVRRFSTDHYLEAREAVSVPLSIM